MNEQNEQQTDEFVEDPLAEDEASAESEITRLSNERDEFRDKFIRALADAENSRKRADKERRDAEQYGGSRLARDLLPVYDALSRGLAAVGEEQRVAASALIEGVELTLRELSNVFGKHGITVINPDAGEKFDPTWHEAMFEAPVPGTKAGEIIEIMEVGFRLHDRLLRPAKVGVSSMQNDG